MTTVPEVLRKYDLDLTEQDIAEGLDNAFSALPGPGAAPLSQFELDYLTEHAGSGAAELIASWDPQQERRERAETVARTVDEVLAGSVGIAQAAALIGVDRSRISHRLSAGALYAVTIGSRRRIPTWQFHDNAELPGLADVVAAIPTQVHPLDVAALMSTEQEELSGRTPVEHLAGGGNPAPVAELVADLGRW